MCAGVCVCECLHVSVNIHKSNADVKISWSDSTHGKVLLDSLNNRNISHVYSVSISLYLRVKYHMGNQLSC